MDYSHRHAAHGGRYTALLGNASLGHRSPCTAGDNATISRRFFLIRFTSTVKKQVRSTDDVFTKVFPQSVRYQRRMNLSLPCQASKEKVDAGKKCPSFGNANDFSGFCEAYLIGNSLKQRWLCTENTLSHSGHFQLKLGQTCCKNSFFTIWQ